jgi:hypothetical protein
MFLASKASVPWWLMLWLQRKPEAVNSAHVDVYALVKYFPSVALFTP